MAGNKMNSKTKGKEDKNKTNRNVGHSNEDPDDVDYSLLRRPIPTSVTGFAQARKVFDFATEELKAILSNECDLLYECKVCRNIFRSLVNFISHKRVYCKEKFNHTVHSHFINTNSAKNELQNIKKLEENYQEFLKEKVNIDENKDTDDRIPLTKDLTSVIEKIAISKGVLQEQIKHQEVVLQKIPKSSVAVYQSIKYDHNEEDMQSQVKELDTILSKENAVLQSDGTFIIENKNTVETENVIQISDDEDNDSTENLKCKVCDQQFSTQKTLKVHVKTKHLESRLVYPCPDCLEIFSTSWSVFRHLFKVHRKTAAQIRRLRETVQAKAFRMNNVPAFYEKRKANTKNVTPIKITEEERIEQENQAWMDNMEGDGELPRCGGCGRTFERRAALSAHTNTCQPRSRALARRPPETKKIEIQIRKDYNKGTNINTTSKPQEKNSTEDNVSPTTSKPQIEESESRTDSTLTEAIMSIVGINGDDLIQEEAVDHLKLDIESLKPTHKLPFSHEAEKSNFNALKQRVLQDIEADDILCKKCDSKFKQLNELFDHVAGHYKWFRYACKLCNFKHYEYEKIPEHVKIVHKLKGYSDFSTVKALDGVAAVEFSDLKNEINGPDSSPNSRRPSRCSSDSSRVSDDSSSSSTRIEVGSRKRKMKPIRNISKKKKDIPNEEGDGDSKDCEFSPQKDPLQLDDEMSLTPKMIDENSSDIDDTEEKSSKRLRIDYIPSASRRPVRKRTKPKNEDFEYDLSNLLKLEAQGYRDSQINNMKPIGAKKKTQQDIQNNYNSINKECNGALTYLSRKSVEAIKAHMKTTNFALVHTTKEQRISNIFVRPMLPKNPRIDKPSPVKENPNMEKEVSTENTNEINLGKNLRVEQMEPEKQNEPMPEIPVQNLNDEDTVTDKLNQETKTEIDSSSTKQTQDIPCTSQQKSKQNINVVPIKLHKQGLDLIKNPLIKKNMTDFSKAGMTTKILVIKPINRKDGSQNINAAIKFQTIKLKDPNSNTKNDEKSPVVVKIPKVEGALTRPIVSSSKGNSTLPLETLNTDPISNQDLENSRDADKKDIELENIDSDTNNKNNPETCEKTSSAVVTDTTEVAVKS